MTPDVQAFPRYTSDQDRTGYTLFNPGSMVDPKNPFISPGAINVGLDSLLRKVFPNLPANPDYVKTHGMLDTATNMANGIGSSYTVDLGNLERGRPAIINTALLGGEDPNRLDKNDMFEQMLKHSSQESVALKDKVKELIKGKKASNTAKTSMLSEEFIKTIAKNKNEKTAGLPGALFHGAVGLAGAAGVGNSLGQISQGREENSLKGTLHGLGETASSISALGDTVSSLGKAAPNVMGAVNNNIKPVSNYMGRVTGGKAMSRLGAIGAPFAVADTFKELGDMGDSFHYGHTGAGIGHGAMAAGNAAIAASNVAHGMNTYKGIVGSIARNAPGILRGAGNVATELGGSIASSAPGVLNSAKNLATGAGNVISSGGGEAFGNFATKASPSVAKFIPAAAKGIGAVGARSIPFVGDVMQGISAGREGHSIGRGIAAGLGSAVGRIGGGTAGSIVPVAGTIAGEIAGSYAGAAGGSALYDKMFGSNNPAPAAPQPGQPVQANSNPVKPLQGNNTGSTTVASPALGEFAAGTNPESVAANNEIKAQVDAMHNDPGYKRDLDMTRRSGMGEANSTLFAERRYKLDQKAHQINPTGAPGEHSGTFEQGKLVTPPNNNAQAPLPEQKSGIPPIGQSNSAPVSGSGNKATPDFSGSNMLKESFNKEGEDDPSIPAVKPMEHIPRPPESPALIQNPQFAGPALKEENRQHNLSILQAKTDQRKSLGLPPNPFLGRVTGVEQTTGGVTTQYKPSSNAIVTDQNEALERAVPMHGSKVDQVDMLNGNGPDNSGFKVNNTGNGTSQLIGPDGKVHGSMKLNPPKPLQPLAKAGSLKRRNTGIGDWVNPEDFKYLSKSANYIGVTPQEYIELPIASEPDTIINFFTPFG
jgi:hypothetical protein